MRDCDGCVMSVQAAALNLDAVILAARCWNQVLELDCSLVFSSTAFACSDLIDKVSKVSSHFISSINLGKTRLSNLLYKAHLMVGGGHLLIAMAHMLHKTLEQVRV